MSWREFEEQAPELALFGVERFKGKIAYLATVKKDGSPRVHPVTPFIGDGHLFIFIDRTSPKGHDIRRDGRYALHCAVRDTSESNSEYLITGRAYEVNDPKVRQKAVTIVGSTVPDRYVLFEFLVKNVLATEYGEDRKPIRRRWKRE